MFNSWKNKAFRVYQLANLERKMRPNLNICGLVQNHFYNTAMYDNVIWGNLTNNE